MRTMSLSTGSIPQGTERSCAMMTTGANAASASLLTPWRSSECPHASPSCHLRLWQQQHLQMQLQMQVAHLTGVKVMVSPRLVVHSLSQCMASILPPIIITVALPFCQDAARCCSQKSPELGQVHQLLHLCKSFAEDLLAACRI